MKEKCSELYRLNNTPFSDICNISSEYPCFRTDIDDPFNLTLNRPCINLTQIGDGKIDCLTGLDERNRLQCSATGMLGFIFNSMILVVQNTPSYVLTHIRGHQVSMLPMIRCVFIRERRFKNGTIE